MRTAQLEQSMGTSELPKSGNSQLPRKLQAPRGRVGHVWGQLYSTSGRLEGTALSQAQPCQARTNPAARILFLL